MSKLADVYDSITSLPKNNTENKEKEKNTKNENDK